MVVIVLIFLSFQGDPEKKEMTDDEMDKFDEKRGEAMSAFSEVATLLLDC